MAKITYLTGNALDPVEVNGNKVIIHCCNDMGRWGSGFVVPLSRKWPKTEEAYRAWHEDYNSTFKLGQIQVVQVELDTYIVNMIGQRSTGIEQIKIGDEVVELPPIRYEAIEECLLRVANAAVKNKATVIGPRFGAGLAMGNWAKIEEIINNVLVSRGIDVVIYDLK